MPRDDVLIGRGARPRDGDASEKGQVRQQWEARGCEQWEARGCEQWEARGCEQWEGRGLGRAMVGDFLFYIILT
jgi:hypothetical protein